MRKRYKILATDDSVVYKDDGKRIVLFSVDAEDGTYNQICEMYEEFINDEFMDILLHLDYSNKDEKKLEEEIRGAIINKREPGTANDLCRTFLKAYYVADLKTGTKLFCNIEDIDSIIRWNKHLKMPVLHLPQILSSKKWGYPALTCIIGLLVGLTISLAVGWFEEDQDVASPTIKAKSQKNTDNDVVKYKLNAVYDPKSCIVYFYDTKFETIDYYIDYQKKIKKIEDINWRIQSSSIGSKDTLFLKDDCTVYLRGEKGSEFSEVQRIEVSYLDFITQLLVTRDPLIKSMLVTNSPTPFGNTILMVDGVPQQTSFYKSSELTDYFKRGFRVTSVKTISSNLNPTNKRYPKLAKIVIQKQ